MSQLNSKYPVIHTVMFVGVLVWEQKEESQEEHGGAV